MVPKAGIIANIMTTTTFLMVPDGDVSLPSNWKVPYNFVYNLVAKILTQCYIPYILIIQVSSAVVAARLREQPAPTTAYTASLELFCVIYAIQFCLMRFVAAFPWQPWGRGYKTVLRTACSKSMLKSRFHTVLILNVGHQTF